MVIPYGNTLGLFSLDFIVFLVLLGWLMRDRSKLVLWGFLLVFFTTVQRTSNFSESKEHNVEGWTKQICTSILGRHFDI